MMKRTLHTRSARRAALTLALAGALLAPAATSAAVAYVSGFSNTPLVVTNPAATNWNSGNISVTPGAGTNRLLVVVVQMDLASQGTFAASATYNGVAVTQALVTNVSAWSGIWIGYVKEANLPAGAANLVVSISSSQSFDGVAVHAGTFSGVAQTTPVNASGQANSGNAQTITLSSSITSNAGGAFVAATSYPQGRTDSITPTTYTVASATNNGGFQNLDGTIAYKLTASSTTESTTSTLSASDTQALGAIALNAAAASTTLTIGNGADPTGTTLTVGNDTAIDQFTLSLSPSGVSTVSQVTVAVTGSAAATTLELRSGTSCTGTLLASVTNPTASTTFTGLNLAVTTTSATYTLCAVPGAVATSTTLSANVSGVTQTGASTVTDNDTANSFTVPASTVTLATGSFDPAANTSLIQGTTGLLDSFTLQASYGTATINSVTLTITGNTLLSSVAIMDNAACSGGTTYGSQASPSASQAITVTGMTAGTTATTFYVCGTATATASGSVQALVGSFTTTSYATAGSDTSNTLVAGARTVTIGNGSDPAGTTLAVGTDAVIDQFTLSLSPSGISTVTQVTAAVTGSAAASTLELRSGTTCTGTLLASVAGPTATTTFTGLNLAVTTTSATYTICAIPGVVATATTLSANVSGLTQSGANAVTDNDTASNFTVPASTVTLATGSFDPAANTSLIQGTTGLLDSFTLQSSYGTATTGTVTLTITGSTYLSNVAIMDNAACSGGTTYGSQASPAASQAITVTGMTAGTTATTFYVCGTATATASGQVKALVGSFTATGYATAGSDTSNTLVAGPTNKTITGTVTAVASSSVCTAIAVTAPYTGDANTNDTLSYRTRTPSGTGTWSGSTAVAHSASPYSFNITGLTVGATYDVEVTYVDADGVTGTAVQTITGITAGASCQTAPGSLTGTVVSCSQVNLAASYTGDSNNNNTVAFTRGSDGVTFGTTVCAATGGGTNPRACTDSTVGANTNYYYRATYADADGIVGSSTKDSGLVAVGACAASLAVTAGTMPAAANVAQGSSGTVVGKITLTPTNGTVTLSSVSISSTGTAQPTDVAQLALFDATSATTFVGAGAWNSSTSHWDFTNLSYSVASTLTFNVVLNVSQGAVTGHTFVMNMNVPADVTVASPQTVSNTATIAGNAFTITAGTARGSTNQSAPMVSIQNPLNGSTVSGTFKVQIRVFNKVNNLGINGINGVSLSTDGTNYTAVTTTNTKYDAIFSDPNWATTVTGRTYETTLSLGQGAYTLSARATNTTLGTGTPTTSEPVQITVATAGKGDGNLLVRDNSSQLCTDCHALQTHSSESVGTKYGAWATTCRDCHAPHGTRNIYLIREQITPPSVNGVQPTRNVGFVKTTGDSGKLGWNASAGKPSVDASYVNTTDNTGPCQTCHTRTVNPSTNAVRWQNTGNADSHYTAPGTAACNGCHRHQRGFAGGNCTDCHATTQPITKGPLAGTRSRRAVVGEFGQTWSHKRAAGGTVTKYDCGVCHMEGDPTTGSPTSYHADGYVDLRDPHTGLQIHDVTPPAANTGNGYTDAGTVTKYPEFTRNLASLTIEPFAAAIMINQCLHCHDGNGATAGYVVPGGTPGKPFATTIPSSQGTYTGAAGFTACSSGTDGCVVNVDASFASTSTSYHPIKARQNNSYTQGSRMVAPWNITKTGANGTPSYGALMTCWDCHANPSDSSITGATGTVTAHGGSVTLRGVPTVTGVPSTTNKVTLCTACHAGYDTISSSTTNHSTGSAFSGGGDGGMTIYLQYGCNACHSSGYTAATPRPLRAEDSHGSSSLRVVGTANPVAGRWSTDPTPYAFIRNRGAISYHQPQKIGATSYTPQCGMPGSGSDSGPCGNQGNVSYTVGGTY